MSVMSIYIDLDSVFDTRLATIATLSDDAASKLAQDEEYWLRESDHWGKLTNNVVNDAEFIAAYAKRDNAILSRSIMTGIIAPLVRVFAENEIAINDGQPNHDIRLVINIHPYTFDDIEMDIFRQLFTHRLGFDPSVTFVSIPMVEVTPRYLTGSFAAAFMYDFNGWIKEHLKNLVMNRSQGFNLIVPRLFEKDVSKMTIDDKKDEISTFQIYLLEYMNISFIDAAFFSMFRL